MPRLLRSSTYRARALRRAATPAGRRLWALVRGRRLDGAKFSRQQPLGRYIVDFFCEEAGLVIEADGAPHFPAPPAQLVRDALLRAAGLMVLRFENDDIIHDTDRVLERIRRALRERLAPPLPSGEGVGG